MATENPLDGKLKRLQDARRKVEEISQRRQRVSGELDGHRKRLTELEKKCRDDFECEITELPGLIQTLDAEAEKSISEAERILSSPASTTIGVEKGVGESKLPAASSAQVQPKAPVRTAPMIKRPVGSGLSKAEEEIV